MGEVWITTSNKDIAQKLLKKHNQTFKGREVKIKGGNSPHRGRGGRGGRD